MNDRLFIVTVGADGKPTSQTEVPQMALYAGLILLLVLAVK